MFPCPCCGYLTMCWPDHSESDICDVCWWQDDPIGFEDPDNARGPNRVSLNEARENFRMLGVSDPRLKRHARAPRPDEIPPERGE